MPPVTEPPVSEDTVEDAAEADAAADVETSTIEPEVVQAAAEAAVAEDAGAETVDTATESAPQSPVSEKDTPTATGAGLFGDREAVAERLNDFPSVSKEDEDSVPSRRGLFGR